MFGGSSAAPSLADIAAVTRNNDGNGNNSGWGDGNGWWVLIILFAIFGGWGNNGYGTNGGGSNGGATVVYETGAGMQRGFDTSQIITKLDGINSGICSLGYDQLAQMNGINSNIMQTGFGLQQGLNAMNIAQMQNTNALSTQLANCCCENRQGQADIKYAMATDTCAITTAVNQAAQNIMQNSNANYRQLHDENVQIQMQAMRDQLAAKDQLITSLNLAASQANQNNFIDSKIDALYDKLSPCPSPAYVVPNPNCCPQPNFWNNNSGCCGNNMCA